MKQKDKDALIALLKSAQAGEISIDQALKSVEAADANEKQTREPGVKMTDKGCIQMTGIRFPYGVVLYPNEWDKVFAMKDKIEAFAVEHKDELAKRGEAERVRKAEEKAKKDAEKAKAEQQGTDSVPANTNAPAAEENKQAA
jgi:hypothetical protein